MSNIVFVVTNELGDFVYGIYDTNEDAVDRSIELGLDGGNFYVEGYTLNADVDPEPDDLAYGN